MAKNKNEYIWNNEEPQPIAVPLPGYSVRHGADFDQDDYGFVGRDALVKELVMMLRQTCNARGCYLISGYRGSGKTSLINRVLKLYEQGAIHPEWLSLVPKTPKRIGYFSRLGRLLVRGREKLKLGAAEQKRPTISLTICRGIDWLVSCRSFVVKRRRIWRPLVSVKVNLGYDQSLEPKEVLFNTTTLLYRTLNRKIRGYKLAEFVVIAAMAFLFVSGWLFPGNMVGNNTFFGMREWVGDTPELSWLIYFVDLRLFSFLLIFSIYYFLTRHIFHTRSSILSRLRRLNRRMASTLETSGNISRGGFSLGKKEVLPPLDTRQIESELLDILEDIQHICRIFVRPDIVFVFDELDKISNQDTVDEDKKETLLSAERDMYARKRKIDTLLGALKNFMTHGSARFFFIAGRETLDSYQAERGSTSSLYESLFNRTYEVPSLLTDSSDHNLQRLHSLLEVYVCRQLLDPDIAICLWLHHTNINHTNDASWMDELYRKVQYSPFCLRTYYHYLCTIPDISGTEARRIILGLRNFVQFLTLHSWGNPKRAVSLFEHFTKPVGSVDWRQKDDVRVINTLHNAKTVLQFGLVDQQRILLASNLYTRFQHDLGEQLAKSGDKLAVSSMVALQYILKFHRHPFSRYHLERMAETLNIYRSPELVTIIDTLLSKVLHPHIRRIRNSHYRYRFNGDFEQEIRYISRVSDIESASFNFSLDASGPVKSHYINILNRMIRVRSSSTPFGESEVGLYKLCMIVGDLYALEQSIEQALIYYQMAVDVFDKCPVERQVRFAHFSIEALLRVGEMYELRHRFDSAVNVYQHARSLVDKFERAIKKQPYERFQYGDSKWDIFHQPFWAYWYLQLKRSPVSSRARLPPCRRNPPINQNNAVDHYRAGQLAFFYSCYYTATGSFVAAIRHSGVGLTSTEKTVYLGAYSYLHLGENLFVGMMRYLREEIDTQEGRKGLNQMICSFQKGIFSGLKSDLNQGSLDSFDACFNENGEKYLDDLKEISDESSFLEKMCIFDTLAMMVHAAKLLSDRGLYYHAALADMKILSIWGMFSEILFSLFDIVDHDSLYKEVRKEPHCSMKCAFALIFGASEGWVSELRERIAENVNCFSSGGHSRFQVRWRERDVELPEDGLVKGIDTQGLPELSKKLSQEWNRKIFPCCYEKQRKNKEDFDLAHSNVIGFDLKSTIRYLFGSSGSSGSSGFSERRKLAESRRSKAEREPIFMQRAMMGQKLIFLSVWEYMAKVKFYNPHKKPFTIPHNPMVPHSTRSLLFSHWLAGRRELNWSVSDKLYKFDKLFSKARLDGFKRPEFKFFNKLKKNIYDSAAAAVHNYRRALYYIRQITGNDQDLMFPDPSIILYDLWRLLYMLVRTELRNTDRDYNDAVMQVKRELSSSRFRSNSTLSSYCDFNNVKQQAIDSLHDIERFQDITNRVRSEAIKQRSYLADDYEDPRFHLDWTLLQMYGPSAALQRRHVELASKALEDGERRMPEEY